MPFIDTPSGVRINYTVVGDQGPYVVLLHGLALSGRFWFTIPEMIAKQAKNPHRVIVIDNRGTGQSSCPKWPFLISRMADDVVAVMDAVGAPTAVVAGLSMGGMIAQHVAIRHPQRVNGLVLMATSPGFPYHVHAKMSTIAKLVSLRFVSEEKAGERLARLLLPENELARARAHLAGWRGALLEEAAGPREFILQLCAVAAHSTSFRLKNISCPTVVLTGAADILMPPKNSEILARRIPRAQLRVLPGVGHGIDIIEKDAICRAIWDISKK
jgi:3-oxoadipate enol-lactonase